MRIENEILLDYKDVLLRPKRSVLGSRKEVDLKRDFTFRNCDQRWSGVPIVAANMDHTGTVDMAHALSEFDMLTCLHKYTNPDQIDENLPVHSVALTIGLKDQDWSMLDLLLRGNPDIQFICLDVANGYSERFSKFVKKVRKTWPDKIIIAGNVVTGEMTEELILNGADIVKVGIGPGSVCTTRIQTGVGYPQLSAVIECADAAHGVGGHIMADGGCTCPGDVAKAFGAGADFVMLGGMLAGHDECSGEVIGHNGSKYKRFYGMSSAHANDKYNGGLSEYRTSEGRQVLVPYRGDVSSQVQDILGGVRSACTYIGARKLKQMPKCTTFIRVNSTHNAVFEHNNSF
ncbi:GMP reductase [bacterium]|nr:GMP reductase [bacterium]